MSMKEIEIMEEIVIGVIAMTGINITMIIIIIIWEVKEDGEVDLIILLKGKEQDIPSLLSCCIDEGELFLFKKIGRTKLTLPYYKYKIIKRIV